MDPQVLDTQIRQALLRVLGGDGGSAQGASGGLQIGHRAPPSGSPTGNYMTGPGGIFGVDGLEDRVIHTIVQGTGLGAALPAFPSMFTNPLIAYYTGVTDVSGELPDGVCDDPQVAGLSKSCIGTAVFGRVSFQSKQLELDRLGKRRDRGEFADLRLLNAPLLQMLNNVTPSIQGNQANILNDVAQAFMEIGLAFQRRLMRDVFIGNPANNTAGGGHREFPGLDILIATGHVDAIENVACPSLDSDIKNANYALVGGSEEANNDLISQITYMWRFLNDLARRTGLEPSTWAIVMRPDLFYELTAIWPCSYLTYRCIVAEGAGERINVDAGDAVSMRDQMRQGSYLVIDGQRVQVLQDSFIPEETQADTGNLQSGQFASDIYFVPLTVLGGVAATYWEFYDYAGTNAAQSAITDGRLGAHYWISDGGRFLWHAKPPTNWCVEWIAKIEPRIRLLTPHLAGRILNVAYEPLQHTRDVSPDDPYFTNGGVTAGRTAPSYYTPGWTS